MIFASRSPKPAKNSSRGERAITSMSAAMWTLTAVGSARW